MSGEKTKENKRKINKSYFSELNQLKLDNKRINKSYKPGSKSKQEVFCQNLEKIDWVKKTFTFLRICVKKKLL